jgi:hypothetical protein
MKLIPPELMHKIKVVHGEMKDAKKKVMHSAYCHPDFTKAHNDLVDVTSWVRQVYFDHARYR